MRAKQSRADKEKKEKAAAALQAAVSTADALTASASTPVAQGSETTSDQTSHPTQGKHSFYPSSTLASNDKSSGKVPSGGRNPTFQFFHYYSERRLI